MGITDFLSDIYNSIGFAEAYADAPAEDEKEGGDEKEEGGDDDKGEEKEGGEEGGDEKNEGGDDAEGGGEDAGGEEGGEEEEEEEDDEPVDLKPKLEEECARSAACSGYKHHYEECVERVTAQHENPEHKGPKEDCVEEFFHLQHCVTACAAPKLFRALK